MHWTAGEAIRQSARWGGCGCRGPAARRCRARANHDSAPLECPSPFRFPDPRAPRQPPAEEPAAAKLLRLACVLCWLGLFYCGYFWLAGWLLVAAEPAAGPRRHRRRGLCAAQRRTARSGPDGLNLTSSVHLAPRLLQDGINSPALRWMIVPLCISLLAGSIVTAATFAGLAALEMAFWRARAGLWLPVSMLAPPPFHQSGTAVVMSTLCLGLIVGFSARWTRGLQRALQFAREAATAAARRRLASSPISATRCGRRCKAWSGRPTSCVRITSSDSQREQLAAIQSQGVKSVLEMLNAVLDFSKLEAGQETLSDGGPRLPPADRRDQRAVRRPGVQQGPRADVELRRRRCRSSRRRRHADQAGGLEPGLERGQVHGSGRGARPRRADADSGARCRPTWLGSASKSRTPASASGRRAWPGCSSRSTRPTRPSRPRPTAAPASDCRSRRASPS